MVRPVGIRHDGVMSNRLSLGARTRLLFLGSAFLVLVVGLLVPWIRTESIVRAYQAKALDEALGRFEEGGPLESDEFVVVLTEDDPQWNALQRTIVTLDGEGMGGIRTVEQRKAKFEPNGMQCDLINCCGLKFLPLSGTPCCWNPERGLWPRAFWCSCWFLWPFTASWTD
ncbi:MAG: hypothetical protein VX001_04985 [Planctomycetota bacterium]|nr:hypothetical protein [Planctomycetota bacterium]